MLNPVHFEAPMRKKDEKRQSKNASEVNHMMKTLKYENNYNESKTETNHVLS